MAKKTIHTSGKRKEAVARVTLRPGTGKVTINNRDLNSFSDEFLVMKIKEPLTLVGEVAKKVNLTVLTNGGGVAGQAEAVRLAIGRALVAHDSKLKKVLEEYDRQLLVADVRRKEMRKPNTHSKARAKRQKSYR